MVFPKRVLRLFIFLIFLLVLILLVLGLVDKNDVVSSTLQRYLSGLTFFQPPSDLYIVDIVIQDCYKVGKNDASCPMPLQGEGKLGDLKDDGGWMQVKKDIRLGGSWFKKAYLSYKAVSNEALNKVLENDEVIQNDKEYPVIVDIAISSAKDGLIEGNTELIPEKILEEFHSNRLFNEDDLKESNIDEKTSNSKVSPIEESKKAKEIINKVSDEIKKAEEKEINDKSKKKDKASDKTKKDNMHLDSRAIKPVEQVQRQDLELHYKIPTPEILNEFGWVQKSNGIWVKYGKPSADVITAIDILFGEDAVDPRPNWELIKVPLRGVSSVINREPYLSIRRGPKMRYDIDKFKPALTFNDEGKFKILQVADLHFSTGPGKCRDPVNFPSSETCKADPRTLEFLEKVLSLERPDFVILTGDQIYGDEAPDAETAVFKALDPFVKRKIPFAVTLGNHDDEGSLDRKEVMALSSNLPYSLSSLGPDEVPGFGNYVLRVEPGSTLKSDLIMYFLDSHKYSQNPKANPGYDWIKESQLVWMSSEETRMIRSSSKSIANHLSMAFFHIPIPEYRLLNQPFIGEHREKITAPRHNSGARSEFAKLGIHAISVGHDHCNDYCLIDSEKVDSRESKMWMCYGGGSGEGGYGGYNNYIRKLRIFEVDSKTGSILTWKRAQDNPDSILDHQTIVSEGNVVNFA